MNVEVQNPDEPSQELGTDPGSGHPAPVNRLRDNPRFRGVAACIRSVLMGTKADKGMTSPQHVCDLVLYVGKATAHQCAAIIDY